MLHGGHVLHASQRMIPQQIRLRQKRYHAFFLFLFLFLFLLCIVSPQQRLLRMVVVVGMVVLRPPFATGMRVIADLLSKLCKLVLWHSE